MAACATDTRGIDDEADDEPLSGGSTRQDSRLMAARATTLVLILPDTLSEAGTGRRSKRTGIFASVTGEKEASFIFYSVGIMYRVYHDTSDPLKGGGFLEEAP